MYHRQEAERNGPAFKFRELNNAHRIAYDAAFEKFGVKEFGQPMILFILERYGENGVITTQKELSERLGVSQTTTAISLKSLHRQGCIRKTPDEQDMRRNRIEITEKGLEVAEKCRKAFIDIDHAMYEGFTDAEIELISDFFARMTLNLLNMAQVSTQTERNEELD